MAGSLLGWVNPVFAAILVVLFTGVVCGSSRRSQRLWDEKAQLCGDRAELEQQLADEKKTSKTVRETASADERAKSAFISSISHELRTPLNAIIGMAQLLERSDLVKDQRDHVKVLLESSRGLKTLLDDIIALSQDSDQPLTSPEEGCDVGQAARTVVRLLQPNVWEKRLRLSLNVAPGLPRVGADPRLLRRVLLKLVGNAVKFTDRGSVEISLDTAPNAAGAQMVRCTITDSGPGIPKHLLAAIFEPFTREDDSYATRHGGAGLGLAVAKRLIQAIGGTIGVESEPGMGASFWITMPALTGGVADEPLLDERVAPPSGLTVLAFVPDKSMRATIERLLLPYDNAVVHAGTLAEAVTMSARGGYSIIIAGALSVDALAAAPGQRTPILALAAPDEGSPDGANIIVRWPASANTLFSAITSIAGYEGHAAEPVEQVQTESAIDIKAFNDLEKSLGFKTLVDILQSYLQTAEGLATSLGAASEREDWGQAARLAQDFAGAAGGLGLGALTAAARSLAQNARDGAEHHVLAAATSGIIDEHTRVRDALRRLYPELCV